MALNAQVIQNTSVAFYALRLIIQERSTIPRAEASCPELDDRTPYEQATYW
jgi:hypothetical protein